MDNKIPSSKVRTGEGVLEFVEKLSDRLLSAPAPSTRVDTMSLASLRLEGERLRAASSTLAL